MRTLLSVLSLAILVTSLSGCAQSAPEKVSGIHSMAVLGDSISAASASCGYQALCPANSWATGTNSDVNSQLARIQSEESASVSAYNDAVPGARVADLASQVQNAISQRPDYVAILVGDNDLCTPTAAQMTSAADYQSLLSSAVSQLTSALPSTRVFISSIPDPVGVYKAEGGSEDAKNTWNLTGECASALANPGTAGDADRKQVSDRAQAYDSAIQTVCKSAPNLYCDAGKVSGVQFDSSDISDLDHFHPSVQGQKALAGAAWDGGLHDWLAMTSPSAQPAS